MKKTIYLTFLPAVVLLLALLAGCANEATVETAEPAIAVKAQIVKASDRAVTSTYTGTLEGEKQTVVYSRLSEAVEKVLVKEGQQVNADQILLTLDRYGASSQYSQTQSVYLNSEKYYKKMKFLYDKGAVSESEYDASKTQYEVNKASFDAVSKMVEVSSAISGVVTSVKVSPGDLVTVGEKLVTVATTDRLRVKFGVNADEIGDFRMNSEVTVTSDAVTGHLEGKVVAIAGSADPVTRSFQVEAQFDNAAGLFRPGMFVRVGFVKERLESVVAVPPKAIMSYNGESVVYLVNNGRAVRTPVTRGLELTGHVVVKSGLTVGDTLVVLGQDYLGDSTKVNITALDE